VQEATSDRSFPSRTRKICMIRALGRPCCSDNPQQPDFAPIATEESIAMKSRFALHRPRRHAVPACSTAQLNQSAATVIPIVNRCCCLRSQYGIPPTATASLVAGRTLFGCRASLTKGSRRPQAPICRAWPRQCSRRRPAHSPQQAAVLLAAAQYLQNKVPTQRETFSRTGRPRQARRNQGRLRSCAG